MSRPFYLTPPCHSISASSVLQRHLLAGRDSEAFFNNLDHLHAHPGPRRANLAGSTVDGAAKSGQGCLHLRHAGRLELLHWEVASSSSSRARTTAPSNGCLVVEADARDRALLGLSHGPQFRVIEVDLLLLHVGDHLLVAQRDGCTKGGK